MDTMEPYQPLRRRRGLGVEWVVHPLLFDVEGESDIRLDWEHTECRWVDPGELGTLDTVPMLAETWERLWRT